MVIKDRNFRAFLIVCFLAASVAADLRLFKRTVNLQLTFEIAADRPSIVQLFYNTGQGFTEVDSAKAAVRSNSLGDFQKLSFTLPAKNIQRFRLDPAEAAGTFLLRDFFLVDDLGRREPLNAHRVLAFHEIAQIRQEGADIRVITTPGAQDPSIELELNRPIKVGQRQLAEEVWPALGLQAALGLCFFLIWRLRKKLLQALALQSVSIRALHSQLVRLGEALSDPDFIRFDALALWIYLICILCFAGSVVADLNGSSSDMLHLVLKRGAADTPLLGEPRAIRSDEWGWATPDVLNQALRTDRFAVANSPMGSHSVSLLGYLPVRHSTTLLRPQFWGFFLFPVDYGFAFFWQSKALLLFLGTFTWILLISGSTRWALTGALWFFFSPSTQWSYSWPSGLPEMIGLSCLSCVAFCYLTVGRNKLALFVAAVVAGACSVNFALCAYVPHLVPLVWLQVAVFTAWCYVSRAQIWQRAHRYERVIALLLCLGVIGTFGFVIFRDVRIAALAISNTFYPGHRFLTGGTMAPLSFAAHLLPWSQTENHFPAFLGNISEGSGFLWLAPATLFCLTEAHFSRVRRAMFIALAVYSLCLVAWLLFPFPAAVGSVFGLDRTFGARCVPALGLANIGLVCGCLANKQLPALRRSNPQALVAVGLLGTAALLLVFTAVNNSLNHFFPLAQIIGGSGFLGLLISLMITSRHRVLPFVLVGSQALFFGAVNPVQQGVRVFTSSDLYRFIHSNPAYTRDEWLIYSNQPMLSGLFAGVGCQVYSGTRYLPDVDHFPLFAARGLDPNAYNRLGFILATLPDADRKAKLHLMNVNMVEWKVAPRDPLLQQLGIRYLAFDEFSQLPPPPLVSGLIPLADHAIDGFWLYRLP